MRKEKKELLVEIKENYNKRLISALVGAGFSKNVSDLFLGWGDLLHDMVGELYAIDIKKGFDNYINQNRHKDYVLKTKEEFDNEYINDILQKEDLLEIVSNYIRKKGVRESVEVYIENKIPYATYDDKLIHLFINNKEIAAIEPQKLSAHMELMRANKLQNIYTTNYDNLLEISRELLRKEDASILPKLVDCGRDLSNKLSSRNIIKIHGNLRKNDEDDFEFDGDRKLCYIIAKEDYETYKEKHEAFTALMRIAMLQGKFMLLGFSGSDANYKGWVSWMSDVIDNDKQETKIYIIDVSGKEPSPDIKLYNRNHHIETLDLLNNDILRTIGFEDDNISLITEKYKGKKLDNDTRREIQTKFLEFLNNSTSDNNNFSNSDANNSYDDKQTSNSQESPVVILGKFSNQASYEYRNLWSDVLSKMNNDGAVADIVKAIKEVKPQNLFPKIVINQDYTIDTIVRKSKIDQQNAFLLAMAIDECGLNPHYYSKLIKDYGELNKLDRWNLLIEKEATFNGKETPLSGSNDDLVYENIQRKLFHLNFEEANRIINDWNPSGYFIVSKAMRLATQKGQEDNALKMLADYISRETNLSTKLYAMQIANYISRRYPWPYDTEVLYQYGIDGIGDMLNYMVQQLRGKVEAPRTRGWIGSTMNFGGSHPGYENSLRILRFISDCGIYPNFNVICFFEISNWYLVFQNLYEEFPYPCFFYSILYRDNNLLTRVGQDFAYSTKLSDFNEDIIVKSLKAINDINTPQCFHEGLVRIICPIYMAVEEKVWYQLFKTHIFTSFIEQISKYDSNSSIVRNIEYALLALKDSEHVNEILLDILTHYRENTQLAYSLICYHLHLKFVKDSIQDSITSVLENLVSTCQLTEIIELFAYLNNEAFLPDEIKKQFIAKLISTHIESIPQKATAFNLCMLVKDDPSALSLAKKMLLKNDIWHCGVMENGEGWIAPNNIRLNLFKKEIAWTDEEFQLIKENLISNIEKYDKHHVSLHNDSFMRHVHIEYLSDVLQFIENLNEERRLSLDDIYMKVGALLKDRLEYNNFIEGMLSHQSSDVDYAMRNVIKGIEAKGVKAYLDEFNYILDYVLSGGNCAVNRALKYIKVVVEKHSKDIIDNRMCSKLYMIISLYKERWESIKEFSPVWSFNYLNSIALFLKNNGYADSESVKYWLHDSFVNKFIR